MRIGCRPAIWLATLTLACAAAAQAADAPPEAARYRAAPEPLAAFVNAPLAPHLLLPSLDAAPRYAVRAQPYGVRTLAELGEPELRLAGFRFNPRTYARGREPWETTYYRALTLQAFPGGDERPVALPAGGPITSVAWSPDGSRLAVTRAGVDAGAGHGLWLVEAATARAHRVAGVEVNSVLGDPCHWLGDGSGLVCRTVARSGAPGAGVAEAPLPVVQESDGRPTPGRTYQDLLRSPADEALLDRHMTMQLVRVGVDGSVRPLGTPGLIDIALPSPDGRWVLVGRRHRPYSFQFPLEKFPHRISVLRIDDGRETVLADKPLENAVPISFDAVGPGRRAPGWRADAPATVYWVEAADGGDPGVEAKVRDEVHVLEAPFTGAPRRLAGLEFRVAGIWWGEGRALIQESWRKNRLRRWWAVPSAPGADADADAGADAGAAPRLLYAGSSQDRYGDPGQPLPGRDATGAARLVPAGGGAVWFAGDGGTPQGDRPFLARLDLDSGAHDIVWRAPENAYATAEAVLPGGEVLIRREDATTAPNYFLMPAAGGDARQVTRFADPYAGLPLARKRLLHYARADGLPLTATLYLPPDYAPGDGPLPTVLHAYPAEFKTRDAAAQVSGSPHRYPTYGFYDLPQLLAQRGYAVLFRASLPVIGEGDAEPNDSFVEQIVAGARAAIEEGVRQGVVDPQRVGVTGHSYGAFMTANLLAHSDLFKAGVALSGAYNRTLTPFGFQNEERTYWQAPEVYYGMSPFSYADRVRAPLLLVHGADDDNQGTFPVQSERFYAALKGNGVRTRLVMLPREAHRYDAGESLEHLLWEWDDWFGRYLRAGEAGGAGPAASAR